MKTHVDAAKYGEYAGRYVKNAYDERLSDRPDAGHRHRGDAESRKQGLQDREAHPLLPPLLAHGQTRALLPARLVVHPHHGAARERMIELNKTIRWKPESTGTGRFGKWLGRTGGLEPLASRFWGTPLPVWATEDYSEVKCIGSVEELMAEIERSIAAGVMQENPYRNFRVGDMSKENYSTENIDLHRPYVDSIVLVSSKGEPMRRESDLIDVWFDSGAMPYAQVHYPFENKGGLRPGLPRRLHRRGRRPDAAGSSRCTPSPRCSSTRWLSRISFRIGLVLDKNGNKMSKRLGNAVDPFEVLDTYGADATRWYMISNSQPWDNLKFDRDGVDRSAPQILSERSTTPTRSSPSTPTWTASRAVKEVPMEKRPEIDRWIISLLNTLVKNVTEFSRRLRPHPAARAIQEFVGENPRTGTCASTASGSGEAACRKTIWAYQTLYTCLETVTMLAAPFAPFISDRIFTDLNAVSGPPQGRIGASRGVPDGRRTADRRPPRRDDVAGEEGLVDGAGPAPQSVDQGAPAADQNPDPGARPRDGGAYFGREEPHYERGQREGDRADRKTTGLITKRIKPNFKTLGPRYGKWMKQTPPSSRSFAGTYRRGGGRAGNGARPPGAERIHRDARRRFEITSEEHARMAVASEGKLTVALDITVTESLKAEGVARELINRIQNIRKDSDSRSRTRSAQRSNRSPWWPTQSARFAGYIASQTLAVEVRPAAEPAGETVVETDVDDEPLRIAVTRI